MRNFPRQRLTYKEKTKDDFKWAREVIDNLLLNYAMDRDVVNAYQSEYDRKLSNYQLFNNQLNQKDFERECNPLGLEVGHFKDEIQPYNKTYNKIQVLLGEELRRPFNYNVVLTNPDGVKSKLAMRDSLFRNYVHAKIQEVLTSLNINPEESLFDEASLVDPQDVDKYMSTHFLDAKEILGSKILLYLDRKLSLKDMKNDAFKHGLISGEELVYVGKRNGEPYVEVLNPLGVFFHKSPEIKWIQESMYCGYRTYMTSGDVMDTYGQYMKEEDLKKIDKSREAFVGFRDDTINSTMKYFHDDTYYQHYLTAPRTHGSYSDSTNFLQDWLVQHVEWKSQKQVGFLTFTNEYGDPQVDMVDENFELPPYAKRTNTNEFNVQKVSYVWTDVKGIEYKFDWGWIPEVWQGVRIGEDVYCMIGPKEYQIRSLENPYDIKLGYHGVIYNSMNAVSVSVMDRMKPFQYLYFIITHKLKKLIAQDKGRIFHLDTTMIDPKIGLEKTLYYLQNLNIEFYNPLQNADQPGWSQRGKVSGSTDLSVSDQIMNYVQLLAAVDQQISDVAGVNRQREGQTAPNEAVTNSQSNIAMSSMVTEVYFQAHNKLWEKILNSLMDVAEICFKNKSLVKQWVLDDQSLATLEFTPDSLTNASFGVFVVDSPKEQQVFDQLQALGQAMIQNDKATLSDWIKVLEGTSTQQLKRSILQSEKDAQAREQQNMQAQMQAADQAQEKEHQFQLELQAREIEGKIAIAQIDSFKFLQDQDADNDGVPDQFEIEKFKTEAALKSRKLNLEAEGLKIQREKNAQDKDLKEKDLKIKSRKSSSK